MECPSCHEPLEDDSAFCTSCGKPVRATPGEAPLDDRPSDARGPIEAEIELGASIVAGHDALLRVRARMTRKDVTSLSVAASLFEVARLEATQPFRIPPEDWVVFALPFVADRAGDKLLESLEFAVEHRDGKREIYELLDRALSLFVSEGQQPLFAGGINIQPGIKDYGQHIGDINVHLPGREQREASWQPLRVTRKEGPKVRAVKAPDDETPLIRRQIIIEAPGERTRRIFLVISSSARFGRAKADQLSDNDKNDLVLRALTRPDPVSRRHGCFEVADQKLRFMDLSSSGTRLNGRVLRRDEPVDLPGGRFAMELGSDAMRLQGHLLGNVRKRLPVPEGTEQLKSGAHPRSPPDFSTNFPHDALILRRDSGAHCYLLLYREVSFGESFQFWTGPEDGEPRVRILHCRGTLLLGRDGGDVKVDGLQPGPGEYVPLRCGTVIKIGASKGTLREVRDEDMTVG